MVWETSCVILCITKKVCIFNYLKKDLRIRKSLYHILMGEEDIKGYNTEVVNVTYKNINEDIH